jgi:hypothetical protein
MHPALMIAVMEERDREIARRTKDVWKQPSHPAHRREPRNSARRNRGRSRLSAAVGRLAFFS